MNETHDQRDSQFSNRISAELARETGYEIVQTLHQGDAVSVHRAEGPAGSVVLKWLNAQYPTLQQLASLQNEFEILSGLNHPRIVRPVALLEVGNGLVLALENVDGEPLNEAFGNKPLPIKEFFSIATQIVDALRTIHDAGYIHKDMKPHNILYDRKSRQIKIIDFGIATGVRSQMTLAREVDLVQSTVAFMSPEQTGRINRAVDHRTDLYSLGATFYALLTGRPPFEAEDALDVVHGHLARVPERPSQLVGMPEILSDIVMKLLSKDAEDRYQTAAGLLFDLETCERQLRETYSVSNFTLATHDRPAKFQMPQRVYGRDVEIKALFEGFERVCTGTNEVLLVTGESGVGKSLLVKEIKSPLVQGRGSFIEGKFDEYQRDRPYSALIDAFEDLTQQLLVIGRHEEWKRRLRAALGPNLGVITDVIPGLKQIVGDSPDVPEVGAVEARNRFTLAFQQFVWVVASREHPIVLFLDDLQWIDRASIDLLRVLLTDRQGQYLYFVGSFRSNEVSEEHPIIPVIEAVRSVNRVETIELGALSEEAVREILLDTFVVRSDGANQLADILMKKTNGNPFFLNEFLRTLHESGNLVFDDKLGEWTWNAAVIAAMETTDNVSDLTAARLDRLPGETMQAVLLAACIGNRSSELQLASKMGLDLPELRRRLAPALNEGVLLITEGSNLGTAKYSFSHDRVRHAAYSRISQDEQWSMHLRIGRHLLETLSAEERSARLFDIVDQLNTGRHGMTEEAEKETLARLNLDAGRRAKSSAAFAPALRHIRIAMELIGDDIWERDPEFARELCLDRGECEYLNGHYDAAEEHLNHLIEKAREPLDAIPAYNVLIAANNSRGQFASSLRTGIAALNELGIVFPTDEAQIGQAIGSELARIREHLETSDVKTLIDLPPMRDPKLIAAMQLLVTMTSTAYIGGPELYPLIVAKQINLSIENGNAPMSVIAYSSYAVLNSPGGLSDLDTSYAFGDLSLRMLDQEGGRETSVNVHFVFGTFISHWRNHLSQSVRYLDLALTSALQAGNFEYVRYAATFEAFYNVLQWHDLSKAQSSTSKRLETLNKIGIDDSAGAFRLASQLAATIAGDIPDGSDPHKMVGPGFDEHAAEKEWQEGNDFLSLSCLAISRIIIANLYGRNAEALAMIEAAKPYLVASTGTFLLAEFTFCRAMVLTASYASGSDEQKAEYLKQINEDLETLKEWAAVSPENFEYRVLFIQAELAAATAEASDTSEVDIIKLYEQAGKRARDGWFLLHEGIIYERAQAFCDRVGLQRLSRSFLNDALYAHERVGAKPKAALLRAQLEKSSHAHLEPLYSDPAALSTTNPALDFERESFFRAAQAVSAAIRMEDLLSELIKILIEFAGAEKCAVIRVDDGDLHAVAQSRDSGSSIEIGDAPLDSIDWLHESVVRYSLQTRSPVVLDDAHVAGRFKDIPDVTTMKSRSVLCLPIVERGKVRNLMYLSNNLAPGVFTADSVEGLKLLSGHVAVSIANSELYEQLEEKVAERTNQLEVRNQFIRKEFGRYMSDEVAESLLANPKGLALGGEQRMVTILMADLRGFTAMADQLEPTEVVRIINNFLGEMTALILKHHGTINDFIGDAILAIFGAPVEREDDAERAIACALEMQSAMDVVNDRNVKFGLPKVSMGIGLHTGSVVVGNVGSEDRVKYGVIGQTVNLASRVESYTVGGQILASEQTLRSAGSEVQTGREISVHPKGSPEPITIHEIRGIGGRYDIALSDAEADIVICEKPFDVSYCVLSGKDSGGETHRAALVGLSRTGTGILRATEALPAFSNLRMTVFCGQDQRLDNLYAKVLGNAEAGYCEIHFTSTSEDLQNFLANFENHAKPLAWHVK